LLVAKGAKSAFDIAPDWSKDVGKRNFLGYAHVVSSTEAANRVQVCLVTLITHARFFLTAVKAILN
jgi:hypothetical protein